MTSLRSQLSPTVNSRVASRFQLISPISSAWFANRLRKILMMRTESTPENILIAAWFIIDHYRLTQRSRSNWSYTTALQTKLFCCPQEEPCSSSLPASQRHPNLSVKYQLNEDVGTPPVSTSGKVRPSHITIGMIELNVIHRFTHLGCTILPGANITYWPSAQPSIKEQVPGV